MADIWDTIATERRRLADELENLTEEQWGQQSQCEAWTVREAAAHVGFPFTLSTPKFMLNLAKYRFNINNMVEGETKKLAARLTNEQIIANIRDNATNQWTPPGPKFGAEIPLSEVVVHGQDIRNALGMPCTVPEETIKVTLEGITKNEIRDDYAARIAG